ncbi:DUF559 domain-containing protein [Methylosinus sporium]|uniref:DUF559 domain-containing protein n=1 Tax=Methylosinus sporium TaxID=428 RepID=UPI00383A6636
MRQTRLMTTRARSLRRELTDAERKLWYALRAHRLAGLSFRRQAPCGPFSLRRSTARNRSGRGHSFHRRRNRLRQAP